MEELADIALGIGAISISLELMRMPRGIDVELRVSHAIQAPVVDRAHGGNQELIALGRVQEIELTV